jgi:hypothetical protein
VTEIVDGHALVEANAAVAGLPAASRRGYAPPRPTLAWERQPGEDGHAYRAFGHYRDSDARSLRETASDMHLPYGQVHRLSVRWKWQVRADAWDQEVDRRKTQAKLKAIAEMEERHVNIALKMQQQVAARLRGHVADTLSNKDLDRWAEKAVRIERQARGLSQGPGVQVNVTQQQAQQAGATAAAAARTETSVVQSSIGDLLAANPDQLERANQAISELLALGEGYSTRNDQQVEDVPGL